MAGLQFDLSTRGGRGRCLALLPTLSDDNLDNVLTANGSDAARVAALNRNDKERLVTDLIGQLQEADQPAAQAAPHYVYDWDVDDGAELPQEPDIERLCGTLANT